MTTATATKTPAISVEHTTNPNGDVLTLSFANGETIRLNVCALSEDIVRQATVHGLKQKLVDAAAIARNTETGRSATVDDKFLAVKEVYDRLLAGNWNKPRAEGSDSGASGLLFKALCRMAPSKSPSEIRAYLDGLDKKQQAALRASSRVAPIIEAIRAEQAKDGGIDGDALLDGLL